MFDPNSDLKAVENNQYMYSSNLNSQYTNIPQRANQR